MGGRCLVCNAASAASFKCHPDQVLRCFIFYVFFEDGLLVSAGGSSVQSGLARSGWWTVLHPFRSLFLFFLSDMRANVFSSFFEEVLLLNHNSFVVRRFLKSTFLFVSL